MRSEWKVTSRCVDEEKTYAVYRLLDKQEPDLPNNREYATSYMSDKSEANTIATRLNSGRK